MKTNKTIITILSIVLFLTACQSQQVSPEKQAILQEIHEKVEQYNAFLEEEKAKGEYVELRLDGKEAIEFIDRSSIRVFGEFQKTVDALTLLNENYYYYSVQEDPSISYPNPNGAGNNGDFAKEFHEFMIEEIRTGDKVTLISANGTKVEIPIGDSYATIKHKQQSFPRPMDTVFPIMFTSYENYTVTSGMYVEKIRSIEGNDANVRYLLQSTNSSMMYPEFEQVEFHTESRLYAFKLDNNQIVWIGSNLVPTLGSPLSIQELETIARDVVAKAAPNIDLNLLSFTHGGGDGREYFFRWTSHEKRLNDGSPTYILVTLTESGELYTYSNEIILAK